MSGAIGQRLKIRLFIEGVEVPIIACQVEIRPNSPIVATIQIPPLAEATRLMPRSLVHVYFLDFYASENPHIANSGNTDPKAVPNPSAFEQEQLEGSNSDLERQKYKLLFCGELVGFNYTKNQAQRSVVLQCLDLSNYWDYAYQWNNTDIFGPGIKALFSGGSTNLFTDFLADEGSEILALLRKGSRTYPNLKGLLGGIVSVLEGIGGTYYTAKAIGGQNIFFSLAELRLHVTQMITAYEKDPTSSNLMNASGYDGLFGRTLGNLGQQVSFRQAINALQGMIFHETFAQSCPLFIPGTYGTTSGQIRTGMSDVPAAAAVLQYAKDLVQGTAFARKELQDIADTQAVSEGDSPKFLKNTFSVGMDTGAQVCAKAIAEITRQKSPELDKLKTFFNTGRSLYLQAKAAINTGWDGKVPMASAINTKIDGYIVQAQKAFQRVVDAQIALTAKVDQVPARLNQQIFRPDVWFSAPPRCNVLFPDQYTSMSYSRAYLAEPTRFLLKTNDEFFGEDELFDNFFFAPKAPVANSKKNDPVLQALLNNGVMNHELFTGVLPIFEKMGELNIFAAQSGLENGKKLKVGLAQRSTNFMYFKHRFSSRQMQVNARFNPYLAAGFPGLILDRYVDIATMERHNTLLAQIGHATRTTRNLLGTHFLGNFTEVTHNIDQGSGTTSLNIGYARQYEESVEYLGAIEKDQVVHQKVGGDAKRQTTIAAVNPPPVGSIGPAGGQVIEVLDVTAAYARSDETFQIYLGVRKSPTLKGVKVKVGRSYPGSYYGDAAAAIFGADDYVTFHAYEVTEEVPRYRQTTVETPAEEYIRPGWYGPIWKPENIGQVYDQFFKTGAITDPTNVTDPQGTNAAGAAQSAQYENETGVSGNDTYNALVSQLDPKASIAQAVEFLVLTYSYIQQAGADADEFIKAYTWRPIASLVDMFGSSDLTLSTDGSRVIKGFEGFHSRAFGQYEDLFGLVTSDIESVLGIKRGAAAAANTDTRKKKQDAVLDYITALQLSRAVLG